MTGRKLQQLPSFVNCVRIDRNNNSRQSVFPHTHENELELFYVHAGEGQYMVANHLYPIRAGDIVICNAGVLHGEEPLHMRQIYSFSVTVANVRFEGLPANWLIDCRTNPVISSGHLADHVGHLMQLLYVLSADIAQTRELCSSLACSMLLLTQTMLRSCEHDTAAAGLNQLSALAYRVRQYLDDHYSQPITLRSAAEHLHISEYYLAHVFRHEFGLPPMQYVMKRRIGEAQELLMHTDIQVAEIADRLGYSNVCHFNAMFKKNIGLPPGKFRESFRGRAAKISQK